MELFPFASDHNDDEGKRPFLGQGYYFWDYNLSYAKTWGRNHYANDYFVIEADITIDDEKHDFFLDLVGNRKDLVGFVNLLGEFDFIDDKGAVEGIDLCHIIDYLRYECPPDVFPFRIIRSVDYKNTNEAGIKIDFNYEQNGRKSYTILNPKFIVSFLSKDDIVYLTKPFIKFVSL